MKAGYTAERMLLDSLFVYGVEAAPKSVTVNSRAAQYQYSPQYKVCLAHLVNISTAHSIRSVVLTLSISVQPTVQGLSHSPCQYQYSPQYKVCLTHLVNIGTAH